MSYTPTPSERAASGGCQRRDCGHDYVQHELRAGRCTAYHCHCRGWVPLTREQYEAGRR